MEDPKRADITAVRQYAALVGEIRDLDLKLKALKAKRGKLEEPVLSYFERQGIQSTSVEGFTVHVIRKLWAGREEGVENDPAIDALTEAGLGHFAERKIQMQTLSAYCRELDENDSSLLEQHPKLKGLLKVNEVYSLGATRSTPPRRSPTNGGKGTKV